MKQPLLAVCLPLALAACSTQPPAAAMHPPDNLTPAGGQVHLRTLAARGVQIYECRAGKDDPRRAAWVFVAPEADLFDEHGRRVGKHYAGPHWENIDLSKVVGSVKASAEAPRPNSVAWLLLATTSDGPEGAFSDAPSVQRINTAGGAAPAATDCTAGLVGKQGRVPYTADYVMFGAV